MAFYESVMVFRGDLTESQVRDKAAKFTEIIKGLKGAVASTEFWGLKALAYVIRKNKRAHYVMLNIDMPGAQLAEYERRLRIDEGDSHQWPDGINQAVSLFVRRGMI